MAATAAVKGSPAAGDILTDKINTTEDNKVTVKEAVGSKKYVDAPPPPTNAWTKRSASLHTDKPQSASEGKF